MDAGWKLQSEIIWSKSRYFPVGGSRRPIRTHEQLFMFSKVRDYEYDADAIREPHNEGTIERYKSVVKSVRSRASGDTSHRKIEANEAGRHRTTVWHIAPTSTKDDGNHYATMPEDVIRPCILAGSHVGGLILDPFCGTGTVIVVAARAGRRAVGVDLSYQELAQRRTAQRGLPLQMETM